MSGAWKDAVVRFCADVLPGAVAPGTAKRYRVSLRQVDPVLGDLHLDAIDRAAIARVAHRASASNATRRRDLTAVAAVLRACVAWGWLDDNAARRYDRSPIRERRAPIEPPTDADVARLVARCPRAFAAIVRLLALIGMRQEEAVGLEWPQIDLARREIALLKTKTNRPRVVPLSAAASAQISAQPKHLTGRYVFWHGDGRRYRNFASRFASLAKAAGVEFRCHDLRHKFAIDWLKAGGDIYRLARILGHASVKTTEIYLGHVGTNPGTGVGGPAPAAAPETGL